MKLKISLNGNLTSKVEELGSCESGCNKPLQHLKVPKDAQLLGQRNLIVSPDLHRQPAQVYHCCMGTLKDLLTNIHEERR